MTGACARCRAGVCGDHGADGPDDVPRSHDRRHAHLVRLGQRRGDGRVAARAVLRRGGGVAAGVLHSHGWSTASRSAPLVGCTRWISPDGSRRASIRSGGLLRFATSAAPMRDGIEIPPRSSGSPGRPCCCSSPRPDCWNGATSCISAHIAWTAAQPRHQRSQRCAHFHGCLPMGPRRICATPPSEEALDMAAMRVLTVYAHPNPKSFCSCPSWRSSRAGLREAGHSVDVVDLYAIKFDPVFRPGYGRPTCTNIPPDILETMNLEQNVLRERCPAAPLALRPRGGCATTPQQIAEVHRRACPEGPRQQWRRWRGRMGLRLHRFGVLAGIPGHPQGLVRARLRLPAARTS